eukprot:1012866-Pelagomonas_calceolata.AAC.6
MESLRPRVLDCLPPFTSQKKLLLWLLNLHAFTERCANAIHMHINSSTHLFKKTGTYTGGAGSPSSSGAARFSSQLEATPLRIPYMVLNWTTLSATCKLRQSDNRERDGIQSNCTAPAIHAFKVHHAKCLHSHLQAQAVKRRGKRDEYKAAAQHFFMVLSAPHLKQPASTRGKKMHSQFNQLHKIFTCMGHHT